MADDMHADLSKLAAARESLWRRAWDAVRAWAREAFRSVPAVECPKCEGLKAEARRWQERAGEWATECLRLEQDFARWIEAHDSALKDAIARAERAEAKLAAFQDRELRLVEEVEGAPLRERPTTFADDLAARREKSALKRLVVQRPATFGQPSSVQCACAEVVESRAWSGARTDDPRSMVRAMRDPRRQRPERSALDRLKAEARDRSVELGLPEPRREGAKCAIIES